MKRSRAPLPIDRLLAFMLAAGACFLGVGCAPGGGASPSTGQKVSAAGPTEGDWREIPAPEGPWRPHRLARCAPDQVETPEVERYLGLSSEFFRDGSGSDGMMELEFGLEAGCRHPLILITLGQLYLMAGQGEPYLLPIEGPAADVGDWQRNKARLLGRARLLLQEAALSRPDDAAVDYLLADVARAEGDFAAAAELVARGMTKCTGGRSFGILQLYQQLRNYPPKFLGGPSPGYPQGSLDAGVTGDVVFDLLISPAGEFRQAVTVTAPASDLAEAALDALRQGSFEAARIGKYPIWSWLRVTTAFNLES